MRLVIVPLMKNGQAGHLKICYHLLKLEQLCLNESSKHVLMLAI